MWKVRIADKVDGVQYWAIDNGIDAPEYSTSARVAQAIADVRNALDAQ
jgi:hypothetical protein